MFKGEPLKANTTLYPYARGRKAITYLGAQRGQARVKSTGARKARLISFPSLASNYSR